MQHQFFLALWVHIACIKAVTNLNMVIWRISTISLISTHREEPVAHFNIANLNKSAEEFSPDNLQAIDMKFAQIVAFYKAYHL